MEESLLAMEIDIKKMPLGKLTKQHIQKGYKVLNKIDAVLKEDGPKKNTDLLRLTNKFYTLIPHDFGVKAPPLIASLDMLSQKMKLMESLINIEIAASLLKEGGATGESEIDTNYMKLKTDLQPLDKGDPEFKLLQTYMSNQKGNFKLSLIDAFKVGREGENERFQTKSYLGNRQLLWHGSRVTNYVGILSQGLRIAPPEAPKSGYRFGKGIYFADICEKSAHYCRGGGAKDTILMMLVEVALGNMKELYNDQYMEQPLPGSDSTKALGGFAPNKTTVTPDGVIVPYGEIGNTGIKSACTHNEYIVYNVSQACIRYLLKIELE
jgi:poly [ADP-ribose] polymerase